MRNMSGGMGGFGVITQNSDGVDINGLVPAVVVVSPTLVAKGYRQVTATGAAFAVPAVTGATIAVLQAEAQALRWRDDGTNPTAALGMRQTPTGSDLTLSGDELTTVKFIAETAGAIANISYYAEA